jgi:hypothetical protein
MLVERIDNVILARRTVGTGVENHEPRCQTPLGEQGSEEADIRESLAMTDHRHRWSFQTARSLLNSGINGILAFREEKTDKYSAVHARRCEMTVRVAFSETELATCPLLGTQLVRPRCVRR